MDYAAWVQRADHFLSSLIDLPGTVWVGRTVAPPCSRDEAQWLDSADPALPDEVKTFLKTVSWSFHIRYGWTPPPEIRDRFPKVFAGSETLEGGAPLARGIDFQFSKGLAKLDGLFQDNPMMIGILRQFTSGAATATSGVPLTPDLGGSRLVMEPRQDGGWDVICESIVSQQRFVVCDGFDQFLALWESMSYLKPHYETLVRWVDADTGRFHLPDEDRAAIRDCLAESIAPAPSAPQPSPTATSPAGVDPQAIDWPAWLGRFRRYLQAARQLPGDWQYYCETESPASADSLERFNSEASDPIPSCLLSFFRNAWGRLECRSTWAPHGADREQLGELLPHTQNLYMGLAIPHYEDLPDILQWFREWADQLDAEEGFGPESAAMLRTSYPLAAIGNGDYLALNLETSKIDPAVVYLSHETDLEHAPNTTTVSDSLSEFLHEWERLGYPGPEIWLLTHFLTDSPAPRLSSQTPLAQRWRAFLRDLGLPIVS